jgi:hypothetical protein
MLDAGPVIILCGLHTHGGKRKSEADESEVAHNEKKRTDTAAYKGQYPHVPNQIA